MEKKNTGLIIFLILIILGLGGYLVYDKVLSKGKQKEEDKLEATMTKEEAETLLDCISFYCFNFYSSIY